jgi:excinuclease ABC subunit B
MKRAMEETERRRVIQLAYNKKHKITPTTIKKNIQDITEGILAERDKTVRRLVELDKATVGTDPKALKKLVKEKERQMEEAVKILDFETAAILRDEISELTN